MDDEGAGSAVRPWRRLSSSIRRRDASIRRREPRSVALVALGRGRRRRAQLSRPRARHRPAGRRAPPSRTPPRRPPRTAPQPPAPPRPPRCRAPTRPPLHRSCGGWGGGAVREWRGWGWGGGVREEATTTSTPPLATRCPVAPPAASNECRPPAHLLPARICSGEHYAASLAGPHRAAQNWPPRRQPATTHYPCSRRARV